jgi:hypothetical protein
VGSDVGEAARLDPLVGLTLSQGVVDVTDQFMLPPPEPVFKTPKVCGGMELPPWTPVNVSPVWLTSSALLKEERINVTAMVRLGSVGVVRFVTVTVPEYTPAGNPVVFAVMVKDPGSLARDALLLGEANSQFPPAGVCTLKLDCQFSDPLPVFPMLTVWGAGISPTILLNVRAEELSESKAGWLTPTVRETETVCDVGVDCGVEMVTVP